VCVSLYVSVCQHNSLTVWGIIKNFFTGARCGQIIIIIIIITDWYSTFRAEDTQALKYLDEFKNGCILVYCGTWVAIQRPGCSNSPWVKPVSHHLNETGCNIGSDDPVWPYCRRKIDTMHMPQFFFMLLLCDACWFTVNWQTRRVDESGYSLYDYVVLMTGRLYCIDSISLK